MKLQNLQSPQDLKQLNVLQLTELCNQLRESLLFKLSKTGGHNGPNLGVVELTTALHYVFNSPVDKIIFDISHQSYIHKMLTGRHQSFTDETKFKLITGYTDPKESEHDHFTVGHTSTSVSQAVGMAKARDLKGETHNVIALIGDGSLSGGLALEGLSVAGEMTSNIIIVVNDNDQSIAENHGGLYKNLKELREQTATTNLFTAMGLDYVYVDNGHDLTKLISTFEQVKDIKNPVVVHVKTTKGKGFEPAENNREKFHAGGPINLETGEYQFQNDDATYTSELADILRTELNNDPLVALVSAGTPMSFGLTPQERVSYKNQFIDVGIAEEHALTMASAMAKAGAKPVWSVFSSFLQRTYDQLVHDTCIDSNPVTILVGAAGVHGMSDVTHLGIFDIPMISNIPNLVYLAPTCMEELEAMVKYAIHQQEHPTAIRIPTGKLHYSNIVDTTDYSQTNKFVKTQSGSKVAIIGLSNFYHLGVNVGKVLEEKYNLTPTIINPKFASGIDEEMLNQLCADHQLIISLEDGQLEGGFGQKVTKALEDKDIQVKTYGLKKEMIDRFNPEQLLETLGITDEQIANDIVDALK